MTRYLRLCAAGVVAIISTAMVGALSRVPYAETAGAAAAVRLAWRVRGTRVEECRRLSPEELARVPAHMRQEEVCEGRVLPYHLSVRLDDGAVIDEDVFPSGARADRPLYVYRELRLVPGTHRLAVEFVRAPVPDSLTRRRRGTESLREEGTSPARLAFEGSITLGANQIALLTYDAERRTLVLKGYRQ